MLVAGKFAWVPHVKLPVKYLWYSGKFTCARRQCACVLREVLAASKQVNLPVITGKLHVTQVNCTRDLFTCELHVKLPAFAGNFARASFTVKVSMNFAFWSSQDFAKRKHAIRGSRWGSKTTKLIGRDTTHTDDYYTPHASTQKHLTLWLSRQGNPSSLSSAVRCWISNNCKSHSKSFHGLTSID